MAERVAKSEFIALMRSDAGHHRRAARQRLQRQEAHHLVQPYRALPVPAPKAAAGVETATPAAEGQE